jgi:hypothetical protein
MRALVAALWPLVAACSGSAATAPIDAPAAPTADAPAAPTADAPAAPTADAALACGANPRHALMPPLALGAGAVLKPLEIVSIVPANFAVDDRTQLFNFGDAVAQDGWYTVVGGDYALGAPAGHVGIVGAMITVPADGTWTKAQAEDYITATIAASSPQIDHTGHTVYVLYAPIGLTVDSSFGDSSRSPSYHAGFPGSYKALGDGWAAIQPAVKTFKLDSFTAAASHEIVEAATDTGGAWALTDDPNLPQDQQTVWLTANDNLHAEAGDQCQGTLIRMPDGFLYTRVFSNTEAALGGDPCLPSVAGTYVNTTPVVPADVSASAPTLGWTHVTMPASGNALVDIPIVGWTADGACATWPLTIDVVNAKAGKNNVTLTNVTLSASTIATGGTVTLHAEVPAGTASGTWGAVNVHSAATGYGADRQHDWVYGVYVD